MKYFDAIGALALLTASAAAANLTGEWAGSVQIPQRQSRPVSLWLDAQGDSLTGYMSSSQGNVPITNATASAGRVSFDIVRDYFGEERRSTYSADVDGDRMILHMPSFGGRGRGLDVTMKRISTATPKPLPPAPPKVSLPAAAPVPSNGLAKTPPMGWNSWNKFRSEVSDKLVRETADAMAGNGMKAAGYRYVNIDDTWQAGRDAHGNILPNERFPDMKALAAYVHGKGLKLGIYSSPGPKTCAGYEGSYGHEEQDAKTYAAWGIDYLKYDWCSGSTVYDYHSMQAVYAKMGEASLHSGRPIVYSLCQYGVLKGPQWGAEAGGNLWRTTGDIRDTWESMSHIGFDLQLDLAPYAAPGHWNDPDMLEIGNGGMTTTEYRTHMSLWSLLAAPLLAGNDLRNVSPAILAILTNKEVIAVDQDALGKQATRVSKTGDLEVWARPLTGGAIAVGLFNRSGAPASITARAAAIGLQGSGRVRDLWTHTGRGTINGEFSAEVPAHGVVMVRIDPVR
ncbi:MAG TPA: hypothetical protein VHD76_11380 [Bryobacteraceae bacterium]|nr:hypothetical protein [Bryobacteraceae bacterium]